MRWLRHQYGSFDTSRVIGPACWPHHDLFFVHTGRVELTFPELEQQLELSPGQGVLIWPQTRFQGHVLTEVVRASIQHFEANRSDEWLARFSGSKNGFSSQGIAASADLTHDVERALSLGQNSASNDPSVREALLRLILVEGAFGAQGKASPDPTRIDLLALQTWLRAHLRQNPGVPELAQQVGLSPSRFRSVFLHEHGRTVGDFIRQVRDNEARRLLVETRQSLKELAAALGYSDAVSFHRAFQTRVGESPGRYRRSNQISG